MINIAIVEDDCKISEKLQEFIRRMADERGETFSVSAYEDALVFLDAYKMQFDIILMDIELPSINGMDAAAKIRKIDGEVLIIFVTYMTRYAVKGYEVGAFDYIVKPVDYFPFSKKLWRAVKETTNKKHNYIIVKTADCMEKLMVSHIKYIEISGHVMQIHTTDKTLSVRYTMGEMEEKLKKYHFLRCNVCYLLNPVFIDKIMENHVIIDGVNLTISRPKKKQFLEELAKFFESDGEE